MKQLKLTMIMIILSMILVIKMIVYCFWVLRTVRNKDLPCVTFQGSWISWCPSLGFWVAL